MNDGSLDQTINRSKQSKQKNLSLRKPLVIFILSYYTIILLTASAILLFILMQSTAEKKIELSLIVCIVLSLVGSCIFYSRKLYKACISDEYTFVGASAHREIGTLFYFLLRPAFSAAFSIVTFLIWEATIISSVGNFSGFSPVHFYLSGLLGYFTGFLAGRILTRMETTGDRHMQGVW